MNNLTEPTGDLTFILKYQTVKKVQVLKAKFLVKGCYRF